MIVVLLALNFLLMIFMPLGLGHQLQKRLRPGWGLFGMGAATFVVSQVGHLPFNWLLGRVGILPDGVSTTARLVTTAVILGLSAGLFEESARYLTYRFWAKEARSWGQGLMLGAGHGGIEAMLLGLLGLLNFAVLLLADRGLFALPQAQMPLVHEQAALLLATPWYMALLGAVERLWAICFHLAASLLVMQVFVRRQWVWLPLAIGWHTLLNATAVFVSQSWGAVATEVALGVLAAMSVWIIFRLRTAVVPLTPDVPPPVDPVLLQPKPLDKDVLDESRFS